MNKILINQTKRPSALIVTPNTVIGYKEEDVIAKRGTSVLPSESIAQCVKESGYEQLDAAIVNRRTDRPSATLAHYDLYGRLVRGSKYDERIIEEKNTLSCLAESAVAWCQAHIDKIILKTEGLKKVFLEGLNVNEHRVGVIATATIAPEQNTLNAYVVDMDDELDISISHPALEAKGYARSLELLIEVLGDNETAFERRAAFHDLSLQTFDNLSSAKIKLLESIADTIANEMLIDYSTPHMIIDGEIGEAYNNLITFVSRLLGPLALPDVQSLKAVKSWLCRAVTVRVVMSIAKQLHFDSLILAGRAFQNSLANRDILNLIPGFLSIAPFDAEDGVLFSHLPSDVLASEMRISRRAIDVMSNDTQGNDIGTAAEIRRALSASGSVAVVSGSYSILNCVDEADVVLGPEGRSSMGYRPWWITTHKDMGLMQPDRDQYKRIVGSDEYGLVDIDFVPESGRSLSAAHDYNNAGVSRRVKIVNPDSVLAKVVKGTEGLTAYPFRVLDGNAPATRWGELVGVNNLIIVE